jgi:hypothetical protein
MRPTRDQLAAVKARWRERPTGQHAICTSCDLACIDVPWCPVEGHGEKFITPCWGTAFGEGSSRPPCIVCVHGVAFARDYTRRRRARSA